MTTAIPSRFSSDWQPGRLAPVIPIRRGHDRPTSRLSRDWGLGASTQQISAIAATGASATVGILVATSVIAGPIGAAAAALIAVGQLIASAFKGCGQTCIEATAIVNQVEPYLQQNLSAYLSAPYTPELQAAAINNFNTLWQSVTQACSAASLQKAGVNCIQDRTNGSCDYHTSPGGWQQASDGTWNYQYPGANGSGTACWNWFVGYLDPIQNDPRATQAAAAPVSSPTSMALTTVPSSTTDTIASPDLTPLLLIAGLVALAVLL